MLGLIVRGPLPNQRSIEETMTKQGTNNIICFNNKQVLIR